VYLKFLSFHIPAELFSIPLAARKRMPIFNFEWNAYPAPMPAYAAATEGLAISPPPISTLPFKAPIPICGSTKNRLKLYLYPAKNGMVFVT
jgi:hypothetical protein